MNPKIEVLKPLGRKAEAQGIGEYSPQLGKFFPQFSLRSRCIAEVCGAPRAPRSQEDALSKGRHIQGPAQVMHSSQINH